MDHRTSTFERIIKEDRVARESKLWRGNLIDYLDVLKKEPTLPKLSHARIYDMIASLMLPTPRSLTGMATSMERNGVTS